MKRREFTLSASAIVLLQHLTQGRLIARIPANGTRASSSNATQLAGPAQGPWRRLFLDATVVEEQQGLTRNFHAAEKYAGNPIIIADRPWEGVSAITGPYVYGTVLEDEGRYRMWYQVLFQGNHVGYAESNDGIHWRKPALDIIQHAGQPTNFVVSEFDADKSGGRCHNPSVILRPNETNPARRYALYGFDGKMGYPRVAFSSDGLNWHYPVENAKQPLFTSSDVVNFGYDPYQDRYYSTWKTRNRRGRAVGVAWSQDGEKWHKPFPGPVFVADDLDPSDTQIYGMPAFPYQGLYIGLPWIYRARYFRFGEYSVEKLHEAQADSPRNMDVQLAWSWDMVNWTRPLERNQFIPRGNTNDWDRGMIVTAGAPLVVDDKLYFYFGGTDRVHDERRAKASIGLAILRLDGFCSLSSNDSTAGWLITRREPMQKPLVTINARTRSGGSITAEILDRKNRVVEGFSREQCLAFQGDSVRHSLRWHLDSFPTGTLQSDYKLRFWLDNAELYSYLPVALDPNQKDLARFPESGP